MGKSSIKFSYPVESVSRKMTLRKNTASEYARVADGSGASVLVEKDVQRYMGGGVRKLYRCGLGYVPQNYLFVRFNARGTAISAAEQAQRADFTNAAKLSSRWSKDMATVSTYMADFKAKTTRKGVSPLGYTLQGYRFAVAAAVIADGGTAQSPWPQA